MIGSTSFDYNLKTQKIYYYDAMVKQIRYVYHKIYDHCHCNGYIIITQKKKHKKALKNDFRNETSIVKFMENYI